MFFLWTWRIVVLRGSPIFYVLVRCLVPDFASSSSKLLSGSSSPGLSTSSPTYPPSYFSLPSQQTPQSTHSHSYSHHDLPADTAFNNSSAPASQSRHSLRVDNLHGSSHTNVALSHSFAGHRDPQQHVSRPSVLHPTTLLFSSPSETISVSSLGSLTSPTAFYSSDSPSSNSAYSPPSYPPPRHAVADISVPSSVKVEITESPAMLGHALGLETDPYEYAARRGSVDTMGSNPTAPHAKASLQEAFDARDVARTRFLARRR